MSDFDMEDDEEDDVSDEDEGPIDIRSLIQDNGKDVAEPAKKKQKK